MKRLLGFLILSIISLSRAGEPSLLELHAVADKSGADTREYTQPATDGTAAQGLFLETSVLLDGSELRSAKAESEEDGRWGIAVVLTDTGKKQFAEATTKYVHKRLGIVLDGKFVSAPVVNEPLLGGSFRISGNFTQAQAEELAARLDASAAKPTS